MFNAIEIDSDGKIKRFFNAGARVGIDNKQNEYSFLVASRTYSNSCKSSTNPKEMKECFGISEFREELLKQKYQPEIARYSALKAKFPALTKAELEEYMTWAQVFE
ncbi:MULTISPECIES: hypothetical protein [unclassified Bradyrhizobium]